MKINILFLYLFLSLFNAYSEEYYISNALGMLLKSVNTNEKNGYEWIVKREVTDGKDIRTIYHNNMEEKVLIREQFREKVVIKEFVDGNLKKETEYAGSRLLKETSIKDKSSVITTVNIWKGNLLKATEYYKNKVLMYKDNYLIGSDGRLHQVRRTFPDGSIRTSGFHFSGNYITTEWSNSGTEDTIYNFSKGSLSRIEKYDSSGLISVQEITAEGENRQETEGNLRNSEKILRRYDSKNRVIYEERESAQNQKKIVIYTYKNDRLTEKIIKEPGLRERHLYSYSEDGILQKETVFVGDAMLKEIYSLENGGTEEVIYKDGIPLLKVVYEDGVIISKEPVIIK